MKITVLASGNIKSNFTYRVLQLSRSLSKLGHEVSIIAPSADKYNDFKPEKISSIDGVNIIQPFQFHTSRLEINLIPYIIHTLWIMLWKKSDLIYIYKPTPISIVGFIGKLLRNTPVFLDLDDLGSEVMKIEGNSRIKIKLVEWCEKIATKYSDKIVVVSSYLRDLYKSEFPQKEIYVMPNGVNQEWFEHTDKPLKKRRIVFLGAINRKNIIEPLFDVLPSVIRRYPEIQILIMGDGSFLEYFKEKSRQLHIDKNIIFTGWVDINTARTMLHAGDIGYNYMPDDITTRAASNMKIPQYMSCGVIPLVSTVGDLVSSVDFGKAGYIAEADNLEALEKCILRALADTESSLKIEHAQFFSEKEFSWDNLSLRFNEWLGFSNIKNSNKKIYIVANDFPDNTSGAQIRNYNLIQQLNKKVNADVTLFSTSSARSQVEQEHLNSKIKIPVFLVPPKKMSLVNIAMTMVVDGIPPSMNAFNLSGIGQIFRKICEESLPDIVQIEQVHGYYAIRKHIPWLKKQGVKIVFDCHNVEFKALADSLKILSFSKKLIGKILLYPTKSIEIEATKLADKILACSELDATFFRKYNSNVSIIPNGVNTSEFIPSAKGTDPVIVFMGGVNYPPNADGIEFYLTTIHPKIRQELPNVKLLLIGADEKWLRDKNIDDSSIKALGFVEDTKPYIDQALVGICPIRYGSGTRLKIMTYMASELAVVSMTKGAEGVPYTNEKNILITDIPQEFARLTLNCLRDSELRNRIAKNGRDFILKNYDWEMIGDRISDFYKNML